MWRMNDGNNILMEQETSFKLIIVGDIGVGKSCLLLRFSENTFKPEHSMTIGVEFGTKLVRVNKDLINLQIWDTAGQECFRSITRSFYRRADGILLVYDITARHTFESCETWIEEIRQNASPEVSVFLIGNQLDLIENNEEERQVLFDEAKEMAKRHDLSGVMETSAKTGYQVNEAFIQFVKDMLGKRNNNNKAPQGKTLVMPPEQKKKKKKKLC